MAKKPTKAILTALSAIATAPQGMYFMTAAEGKPLEAAGLIESNASIVDPSNPNKVAVRLTQEGQNMVSSTNTAAVTASDTTALAATMFTIMTDVAIPESKRGNRIGKGSAPKYPFADMPVGGSFFVPVNEKHSTGEELAKSLGSVVSAKNHEYSEGTGQFETVSRTKRTAGNKAALDEQGNKVKETVQREIRKPLRKFVVRPIEAGVKYGNWTAPQSGALVARVAIEG